MMTTMTIYENIYVEKNTCRFRLCPTKQLICTGCEVRVSCCYRQNRQITTNAFH